MGFSFIECLFTRYLNENPEVTHIFTWADSSKSGSEQRTSPGFIRHTSAIGEILAKCLTDLNGVPKFEKQLKHLGDRHNQRQVQFHFYEVL